MKTKEQQVNSLAERHECREPKQVANELARAEINAREHKDQIAELKRERDVLKLANRTLIKHANDVVWLAEQLNVTQFFELIENCKENAPVFGSIQSDEQLNAIARRIYQSMKVINRYVSEQE
jgi:ribosomal protein L9